MKSRGSGVGDVRFENDQFHSKLAQKIRVSKRNLAQGPWAGTTIDSLKPQFALRGFGQFGGNQAVGGFDIGLYVLIGQGGFALQLHPFVAPQIGGWLDFRLFGQHHEGHVAGFETDFDIALAR